MAQSLQESKKSGSSKRFIVIIIAFFMLPIVTAAILYMTNESFKYSANNFLSLLPGNIGGYFENQPTRDEKEELKILIAKHYATLEEDRIVDKLSLVKSEDIKLYNDLLVQLNKLNPKKMTKVKDELRKKEVKGDLLYRLAEQIDLDTNEKFNELAKHYLTLDTKIAVEAIQNSYANNEVNANDLAKVFELLPRENSVKILSSMDSGVSDKIRYLMASDVRNEIDKQINENEYRKNELVRLAMIYEEKDAEELITEIGSVDKFKVDELAVIYSNISYKKAGEVLAKVSDQEFIFDLYNNIKSFEELYDLDENRPVGLAKSVQTIKDYNTKVAELAGVYQRMARPELARIVEQMSTSNEVVVRQDIVDDERIIFTQKQLIIDVLKQFKPNVVKEIMEQLDTKTATELSSSLVE